MMSHDREREFGRIVAGLALGHGGAPAATFWLGDKVPAAAVDVRSFATTLDATIDNRRRFRDEEMAKLRQHPVVSLRWREQPGPRSDKGRQPCA